MIKNAIIVALLASQLFPYSSVVVDPEPYARHCVATETKTFLCVAALKSWHYRDGAEAVASKLFGQRLWLAPERALSI